MNAHPSPTRRFLDDVERACGPELAVAAPRAHPALAFAGPPRHAERELARVYAVELAHLLRQASRTTEFARSGAPLPTGPSGPSEPSENAATAGHGAWRAALLETLDCASADRLCLAPEVAHCLIACRAEDPLDWPAASELALAALRLDDGEPGRLRLALAWISEDRPRAAAALLARLLSREPHGPALDLDRLRSALRSALLAADELDLAGRSERISEPLDGRAGPCEVA